MKSPALIAHAMAFNPQITVADAVKQGLLVPLQTPDLSAVKKATDSAQDILKAELTQCACVLDYAMRFATSKGETQLASECWHAAAQARLTISRFSSLS